MEKVQLEIEINGHRETDADRHAGELGSAGPQPVTCAEKTGVSVA